jgi:hypothetical protein
MATAMKNPTIKMATTAPTPIRIFLSMARLQK